MKCATTALALGLISVLLLGCPGILPSDMMDLTTPAPCTADSDCGDGIACIFPNGIDQEGICDVDETLVSTGTPAPCSSNEDCPEDIPCVLTDGREQDGFCDIEETLVP